MPFLSLLAISLAVVIVYMTIIWLISLALTDASIVDIFWGMGFAVVNVAYYFLADGYPLRKIIITVLVVVWGLRLSGHIFQRNWGKGEDFRYQAWRTQYGKHYWWISFFQVFMLQGVILWVVSLPLLAAQSGATPAHLTLLDAAGIALWSIGVVFETVGDWQLSRFKANPANKGKVLDTGLWAYTRHPNYFGDAVVWWGFFGLACSVPYGWLTIISPLVMNFLLVRVSGVAMLEKSLVDAKPQYKDYIENTPAFFPWFPKRRK